MESEKLKEKLLEIKKFQEDEFNSDPESEHFEADRLLLDYINDKEITAIFESINKWYA